MSILISLIKKEFYQIVRDPSSVLISVVMPLLLLFIFGYGVNLDNNKIRIGLYTENNDKEITDIVSSFENTKFLDVVRFSNRKDMADGLVAGKIRGMVIFPSDFAKNFNNPDKTASIEVVTDGSETNTAIFVQNYITAVVGNWQKIYATEKGIPQGALIDVESRIWFNPELKSRYILLPTSISIIMTLIGMILTALVVAREWERGTMEALLTTKATRLDIILGKYIPYYVLGMFSTIFCFVICTVIFGVPFRGSFILYFITSSFFLLTSLGQGLLISTLTKNQFLACITAASIGFMPATMFSGAMYEISSMPPILRIFTYIVPARYYTVCVSDLFLAGNTLKLLFKQSLYLMACSSILFGIIYHKTNKRLE